MAVKSIKSIKSVKWEYTVYPPKYKPGDGYTTRKTLAAAKRLCVRLGSGSSIMRTRHAKYSDGSSMIHSPEPAEWVYN